MGCMDYLITAPVILVKGRGREEEPYMAQVSASTENEAVSAFQRDAKENLVHRGPCTDVEFHSFKSNKEKYEIKKNAKMPRL